MWALEDVEVRGDLCRPIYYTRANGDQTTATWSTTRTGTATAVTFDLNATGVVQNGHTVTATGATWTVYDLDVEAGGSVVMGTTNLEHYGTALTNNNSFTIGTGAVTFRNPGAVTMSGSGTCRDVCRELAIECVSGDIHHGFDLCEPKEIFGESARFERRSFDFIWIHPPYWRQKLYAEDARDLSRTKTLDEFLADGSCSSTARAASTMRRKASMRQNSSARPTFSGAASPRPALLAPKSRRWAGA